MLVSRTVIMTSLTKTFAVGEVSPAKKKLLKITEESLYHGLENAKDGNYINDVSLAIQRRVKLQVFQL